MAQEPIKTAAQREEEERKRKAAAGIVRGNATALGEDEGRRRGGAWLFRNGGANLIGVLAILGLLGFTLMAASQPDYFPLLFGLKKKVQTSRVGNSVLFPVEGRDKAGKLAKFDIVQTLQNLAWVRGSGDQVAKDELPIPPTALGNELFGLEVQAGLKPSSQLIAVGLASHEGGVAGEEARATQRGNTAKGWISSAIGAGKTVSILNLGQFSAGCAGLREANTSWERPFVMIGVRSTEAGVNLVEALGDALNGKTNLPSTDCYSKFNLS